MQPLSFFFDNIGATILRGNTPVLVTDDNYLKLYDLQSKDYTFRAQVRIHKRLEECESCSA